MFVQLFLSLPSSDHSYSVLFYGGELPISFCLKSRCNWHITLYSFQVYSTMIWYLWGLQSNRHHPSSKLRCLLNFASIHMILFFSDRYGMCRCPTPNSKQQRNDVSSLWKLHSVVFLKSSNAWESQKVCSVIGKGEKWSDFEVWLVSLPVGWGRHYYSLPFSQQLQVFADIRWNKHGHIGCSFISRACGCHLGFGLSGAQTCSHIR